MAHLRRIGPVEDDRVAVEAGATWSELLTATLAHGKTPPVLPDSLELSVGGTLAVGGVGGDQHGARRQTDHVLDLDVVTGKGDLVRCSASRHPGLFNAVRGGLGQVAVIVRATLALVPARSSSGVSSASTRAWPACRRTPGASLARPGGSRLMTFIGDAHVDDVVAGELERLDPPADLGPFGQVALSPIDRTRIGTPLVRAPDDPLVWALNLVRVPATDDRAHSRRLVAANRATYERLRARGGTLYPVSAFEMTPDDWRRHFGSAFAALAAAKRRFDPGRTLTPGYEVFER